MQFRDFLTSDRILPHMSATTKQEAIAELAEPLFTTGAINPELREGVLTALFNREKLQTTAVGQGLSLAIPHAKHPGVKGLVGVFGRSMEGVPFESPDGRPVRLVFLLMSSREVAARHLEALAYISRKCRDESFRNYLMKTTSQGLLADVIEDSDNED